MNVSMDLSILHLLLVRYRTTVFSLTLVVVKIREKTLGSRSRSHFPDPDHLVRNLAKYHHMKQKSTLILLVISMESDVMNSAASGLVNEIGAADRWVGGMTRWHSGKRSSPVRSFNWSSVISSLSNLPRAS